MSALDTDNTAANEVVYDGPGTAAPAAAASGCHGGRETMRAAAEAAGKSAVRRIRRPTRSDPKAGHMLCGWSCGPAG